MNAELPQMSKILNTVIDATVGSLGIIATDEFNGLMVAFLKKLQKMFVGVPELAAELQTKRGVMEAIIAKDSTHVISHFYRLVSPHVESDHTLPDDKRDGFIHHVLPQISLLNSLRITEYWDCAHEDTKNAIWNYIKQMWEQSYHFSNAPTKEQLRAQAMDAFSKPDFHESMQQIAGHLAGQLSSGFGPVPTNVEQGSRDTDMTE